MDPHSLLPLVIITEGGGRGTNDDGGRSGGGDSNAETRALATFHLLLQKCCLARPPLMIYRKGEWCSSGGDGSAFELKLALMRLPRIVLPHCLCRSWHHHRRSWWF